MRLRLPTPRSSPVSSNADPPIPYISQPALSLIELLVVMAILLLVTAISVPVISHARANARSARCVTNLAAIGQSLRMYVELNSAGTFPDPGDAGTQWEDLLGPYVNQNVFCCPSDPELYAALNSSYDWRDTADPLTTLAGVELTPSIRSEAVLSFDSLPGWHARGFMNAVLIDGSVQGMQQETCLSDLLQPIKR